MHIAKQELGMPSPSLHKSFVMVNKKGTRTTQETRRTSYPFQFKALDNIILKYVQHLSLGA